MIGRQPTMPNPYGPTFPPEAATTTAVNAVIGAGANANVGQMAVKSGKPGARFLLRCCIDFNAAGADTVVLTGRVNGVDGHDFSMPVAGAGRIMLSAQFLMLTADPLGTVETFVVKVATTAGGTVLAGSSYSVEELLT